jgi:hypothetical protein
MRFLFALLVAAIGASSSHGAFQVSAGQAVRTADGGSRSPYRVSSAIAELRVDRAQAIPQPSPPTTSDEGCRSLGHEKVPTTSLGREIARRGWHVTSEARVQNFTVVAYVRNLLGGTSAMCFPVDGHVAIADRGRLIAIVSNAGNIRARVDMGFYGIGGFRNVFGSANLRITDGTAASAPIGELHIRSGRIHVGPLAAADRVCRGRASVPNVYDRPISIASRTLARAGWRPSNGRLGRQDCSGTGVGYCIYNYRQGRRSVDIITVGEEHHVVNYEPHC